MEEIETIKITNLPGENATGLSKDLLQLAASISKVIYDHTTDGNSATNNRVSMQNTLIEMMQNSNSDHHHLSVRFLDQGATIPGISTIVKLKTPFSATITGKTLILGWRGTHSIPEIMVDIKGETTSLEWANLQALEVHKIIYHKVMADLQAHQKALIHFINGEYNRSDPNKHKKPRPW